MKIAGFARTDLEGIRGAGVESRTYFWTSSEPETLMKVQSVWWATALASKVLPVPGGPYSNTPCMGRGAGLVRRLMKIPEGGADAQTSPLALAGTFAAKSRFKGTDKGCEEGGGDKVWSTACGPKFGLGRTSLIGRREVWGFPEANEHSSRNAGV